MLPVSVLKAQFVFAASSLISVFFPSVFCVSSNVTNTLNVTQGDMLQMNTSYARWTKWSKCDLTTCERKRFRVCRHKHDPAKCSQGPMLMQTKRCRRKNCRVQSLLKRRRNPLMTDLFGSHSLLEDIFFTPWSTWTDCYLNECRQYRWKICDFSPMCGTQVKVQQKFCDLEYLDMCLEVLASGSGQLEATEPPAVAENENEIAQETITEPYEEMGKSTFAPDITSTLPEFTTPFVPLDTGTCGVAPLSHSRVMTKIYGGQASIAGQWPWQVALLDGNLKHYCAGTLISNWVLTAAHCIKTRMCVLVGEHEVHKDEDSEQLYRPSKVYIHRNFSPITIENDIALIKIKRLSWSTHAHPICLPETNDESHLFQEHTRCVIAGWGKRRPYSSYGAGVLHEVDVEIIEQQRCREAYAGDHPIYSRMICAGSGPVGKGDTCQGDSGGPLMCKTEENAEDGPWRIVGITSFGDSCGKKNKYGVYTRVSAYLRWIADVMAVG